jgi:hypothetical protein
MSRYVLGLAVLSMSCTTGRGAPAPTLVAYAGAASDVVVAEKAIAIQVERVPEAILGDPARMLALRLSMERQIESQTKDISEGRYRRLVRPRLARELLAAGLAPVDVDGILLGVDYHRSP